MEDPEAAAWRLAALIDGLAAAMLVRHAETPPATAERLIKAQIRLELREATVAPGDGGL